MQALKSNITKGLQHNSYVDTCDNSGAKVIKVIAVLGSRGRTVKGRSPSCGVGDIITAAVKKGKLEMKSQVVYALIVRQKKEYRRPDGTRIAFEDNAAIVLKDEKGNPKGTIFKGPIAREVAERWPAAAKIASVLV